MPKTRPAYPPEYRALITVQGDGYLAFDGVDGRPLGQRAVRELFHDAGVRVVHSGEVRYTSGSPDGGFRVERGGQPARP